MADVDRDRRVDLLIAAETWEVAGDQEPSALLYGDGVDAAGLPVFSAHAGIRDQFTRFSTPMGAALGDPDGDGDLEILVTVQGPSIYMDRDAGAPARDLTLHSYFGPVGLESLHTSWGAALEDFDGDGATEALLVAGAPCGPLDCPPIPDSQHSRLLRYPGGEFRYQAEEQVPDAGGLAGADGEYRNARGVLLADLDGDGRDELLLTPFRDRFRLYRNVAARGHVLRVELRGAASSPTPIGAEVTVTAGGRARTRQLVAGGSTHTSHGPGLAFELGDVDAIDDVTVTWPTGEVRPLGPTAVDATLVVDE
jgi:hypothetical protein